MAYGQVVEQQARGVQVPDDLGQPARCGPDRCLHDASPGVDIGRPVGMPGKDLRCLRQVGAGSNRQDHTLASEHRWLMDFVGGRPTLGPATLLSLEAALKVLAVLELDPATQIDILTTVNTYVTGAVLRESQEIRTEQAEREARALHSQADAMRDRQAWRDRLLATGLFPHFVRFLDADVDPDAAQTRDARFEFGLDCLLDGVAARIGRQ